VRTAPPSSAATPTTGTPPTGVLYVNLGSPAEPTPAAVRAFLDEFLGDPLLVDVNRWLWWFVRKAIILPLRGPKSAALYRRIWTTEGSPLVVHSRRFARALAVELGAGFRVELAMRYGQPSIARGLSALAQAGCARVLVLTAFPQASRATTGTIEREARRALAELGGPPVLEFVPPYYDDPRYIAALAGTLRERIGARLDGRLVLSFHGLPVRYVAAGDPYEAHCEATARALATELGLAADAWTLGYQSRFGREPWLEPDVAAFVPELAARQRVLLAAPSFTTDCLETLEELGLRLREACERRGGELELVPCLNDAPEWVRAAGDLVRAAGSVGFRL
jgi:protoporphyrin/coproporphyrin ferrochelatase